MNMLINARKLFLLFVLFSSAPVFAQQNDCREYGIPGQDKWFKTVEEACRAWGDYLNAKYPGQGYGYRRHEGGYCSAWSSGPSSPLSERVCSENQCEAKKGKLTWQYVPVGKIKITNLDKGTYDFKRVPPPPKVCFEGCEAASPGKYIGVLGASGVDLENTDANGYHTTSSNIEYTFSGNLCVEGEHNIPGKPPETLPKDDEEKCKFRGGYFGQVNGKNVCLGADDEKKCLPGQTYGQINGKDVCLTPEGEQLPVPEPGDGDKPGNGSGNGNGNSNQGNGNSNAGNGQGNGSGGGGSGPYGNGKGDGEGEGEGECAKHPDRLGCLKLGEADGDGQLGRDERNVKFEAKDLRLPTACPAPRRFSLSGMKWEIRFDFLCQVADTARPFVILMATFFTVVMVVGGVRKK